MTKETFEMEFEVTDTFGDQANYSWVKRQTVTLPVGISDRAIVRRLKAFAGFTGMKARVWDTGDHFDIRPYGLCQVAFAQVIY